MEKTTTCGDRYHKSSLAEFTRRSKFAKSLTLTPVISDFKVAIKQSFRMTFHYHGQFLGGSFHLFDFSKKINKCSCVQETLILESMFRYFGNPVTCEDSDLLLVLIHISFPTRTPIWIFIWIIPKYKTFCAHIAFLSGYP